MFLPKSRAQALRAALQQSFQLLLDGFLVLLNEGLGADPEKGRAAAAQAARILRKIRGRLKAKASTKIGELEERLQKEVAKSEFMGILAEMASERFQEAVEFSEICRRRLQALLETARSKMPEQDQELLPDQPVSFLRDHLLVGAWLALFVHVLWRNDWLCVENCFQVLVGVALSVLLGCLSRVHLLPLPLWTQSGRRTAFHSRRTCQWCCQQWREQKAVREPGGSTIVYDCLHDRM